MPRRIDILLKKKRKSITENRLIRSELKLSEAWKCMSKKEGFGRK